MQGNAVRGGSMTATVLEGQKWTDECVQKLAKKLGVGKVKVAWRHPENGMDWGLEISSEEEESVEVPIWFIYLKRLDAESKKLIEDGVKKALEDLAGKSE